MVQEQLPADRIEEVCRHVDRCSACQSDLDRLTETIQTDVTQISLSENAARILEQLKQDGPPVIARHPEDERILFPLPPNEDAPLGRLGRYCILEEVGRGGTGYLFKAFDPELNRHVAVKVLRSELAVLPSSRQRFTREGQAIAKVDSPNIVQVHEVGTESGFLPYLIMQLIDGEPLTDFVSKKRVVEPERAAEILIDILAGLADAHRNDIVHRDVKSANVLLDENGRAKLVDFGLARLADQSADLTREGSIVGTPAYMSPEQILTPQNVDERTDIYSAGIVLYELLTGETPFRGVDRMVMQQIVHDEPRSLRSLNDGIERDLENICLKAISRSSSNRYPIASEFRDDLIRWQRSEPVSARTPGMFERAARACRRHPLVVSMCAIVTVLCCGLIGIWADFTLSLSRSHAELLRNHEILRQSDENASLNQTAARSNAQLAQNQADLSLRLINELTFDVPDQLKEGTDPDDLRGSLLRKAIDGIDKLSEAARDPGALKTTKAVALNRLGDVYRDLGDLESACETYSEAINVVGQRENADVPDTALEMQLLRSHVGISELILSIPDQGKHSDRTAEPHFGNPLELQTANPSNPTTSTGSLQRDEAQRKQHLNAAVRIGKRLLEHGQIREAAMLQVSAETSIALRQLADTAFREGHPDSAVKHLSQLVAMEEFVGGRPIDDPKIQTAATIRYAGTLIDLAELQNRTQSTDAIKSVNAALDSLNSVCECPNADTSCLKSRCFDLLGRMAHASNDLKEARDYFRQAGKALTISDNETDARALRLWCQTHINLALTEQKLGQSTLATKHLNFVIDQLGSVVLTDELDQRWMAMTIDKVKSLLTQDNVQ